MSSGVVLHVKVSPGARREGVGGSWRDAQGAHRLAVRVSAPPEDGRANKAVCDAIAAALGLPKSAIALTAGEKSRLKTLTIMAPDVGAVRARIEELLKETP